MFFPDMACMVDWALNIGLLAYRLRSLNGIRDVRGGLRMVCLQSCILQVTGRKMQLVFMNIFISARLYLKLYDISVQKPRCLKVQLKSEAHHLYKSHT